MTKSTEVKRPSMLGHPKYRAREERRRLLKLCQRKLRSIEDPEQILRRAVLINNTMKQLQARDVCPGEEREGWGRQCEERTVEMLLMEELLTPPKLLSCWGEKNLGVGRSGLTG